MLEHIEVAAVGNTANPILDLEIIATILAIYSGKFILSAKFDPWPFLAVFLKKVVINAIYLLSK